MAGKRKAKKKVKAILYEDGSVAVVGPNGRISVPNVGEGGRARGGHGTVRAFGPTNVRDPFRGSGTTKKTVSLRRKKTPIPRLGRTRTQTPRRRSS